MSESGHSQPGLYGIERRRRWKEPGPGGPQNLSGPGGRERDYIAPWERERRDGSEETSTSVIQKTPIILSKPPAERSKQPPPPTPAPAAPPAPAPLEKPIVLMKPREEGKGTASSTGTSTPEGTTPPPPAAPTPPKGEKEGQRPTQPVYQIQNRGMGTAAPAAVDPVVGQAKLLPPERMKHSIKLVDDQMNWCDSAIEVSGVPPCLNFPGSHAICPSIPTSSLLAGNTSLDSFGGIIESPHLTQAEFQWLVLVQLCQLIKYFDAGWQKGAPAATLGALGSLHHPAAGRLTEPAPAPPLLNDQKPRCTSVNCFECHS